MFHFTWKSSVIDTKDIQYLMARSREMNWQRRQRQSNRNGKRRFGEYIRKKLGMCPKMGEVANGIVCCCQVGH